MGKTRPMSILPPGMDGRQETTRTAEEKWQAADPAETLVRHRERTNNAAYAMQRANPSIRKTVRPSTPEEKGTEKENAASPMEHPSPRSIPGGEKSKDKRQGLVFQDSYSTESLERKHTSPPVTYHSRPRTRTLEESRRHRSKSSSVSNGRHRIGSVHSTSATSFHDVEHKPIPDTNNSSGFPSLSSRPPVSLSKSNSTKAGKKLVKRGSRPTSPLQVMVDVPSVDSLPYPVTTGDANKILMLMKNLCGRMRGDVEYRTAESEEWYSGVCYIDESKASLMYEGEDRGPFHVTVISDLRGCLVRPTISAEDHLKCLEISNRSRGIEVMLLPLTDTEFDLWLAALLCWQQIRNGTPQTGDRRPSTQRRGSIFDQLNSSGGPKPGNIIKVAKLLLWDKGTPTSPKAIVRRPSTKDLRSPTKSSWRKMSCILQDNGEFKLLTENDVTLLSVIQLSQLSRCAIQRLDKSVLDEEYCIGIFPQYTSTSTQLSIFRPVYIALESRLTYEVWFCLLRAFTIPEIYGPQTPEDGDTKAQPTTSTDDIFRIEKSLSLRVVEAKLRKQANSEREKGKPTMKAETDLSIGDYLAEVLMDGELRAKTTIKTETRNPFWREDCEFQDLPSHSPKLSIVLKRLEYPEVFGHGLLPSPNHNMPATPSEFVYGIANVSIDKLERGKENETWWPILDGQQGQVGEVFLKIRHDEIVVLPAKDYQEISELLHRFASGLTLQIAQTIPSQLRAVAELLMNIFQVSGHSGEWLMALVEDEIDGIDKETPIKRVRWSRRIGSNESLGTSSEREQNVRDMGKSLQGEANLLFRGNSLLTQALDFHMRRLGKDYLDDVLSHRIVEINSLDTDCEVDPSRISPGQDVTKNWTQLISLTTSVWDGIRGSAARCPPELRQILKYIRAVAEDRYGDFHRSVAYTSVSGFLFLRFFCPALLNPKLFGLLRDHPQPKSQRALTLVAKSLQALANLSSFGAKEAWMEPMNRFLSSHRQGVKKFIDDICAVPADRNTFAVPASYSTPITILARLPPTSREGFPSLPFLIDHARNFASLVKLWLEATAKYIEPTSLEGDLYNFHQLCVSLQQRTDDCLRKAEQGDRSADQLSLQWEDIIESLEASHIQVPADASLADEPVTNSPLWAEFTTSITAGPRRAPGSAGSELGNSKDRKDRQGFWEATFGKDGKNNQKPSDPMDPSQASPPSRGQSRNSGKPGRGFLSILRQKDKGKDGNGKVMEISAPMDGKKDLGASWSSNGGMI